MNSPFPTSSLGKAGDSDVSGDLCFANAQLVLADQVLTGALTIEQGVICDITEGDHIPTGAVDCAGDLVLPGLVELHTDNVERHIEPRPAVDWPHLPALIAHDAELASTGITTVFDAMRVGSIHSGKGRYTDYARKLADELLAARAQGYFKISHFLHLRAEICSETLLEELAAFGPSDRVGIVSLMDHTPGQRQFRDLSALKTYIAKKRGMDDAEFGEHVERLLALQKRLGARHEAGAVQEARRLRAVLASHDDTTCDHVQTSAGNGVGFAEFPTTVEAADACRLNGIAVMMGAPNLIRGGSHSGNVAAEVLAKADLLDIVSSDYVPSALLWSAFRLADIWSDLPRAIATVTSNPAKAVRLHDRGALKTGLRGDVLRVRSIGQTPLLRGVWSRGNKVA
ncbi:alpha-D-ribose 1-methylphosphonate 5-triphosphate diphosphatase [Roseobacter denitrificans]|uniref:Phosphonate metabolism protein PhnM n=1 Tax=Roseobacter denitrificans (strain ATCC 33942 / OCh 114) TaxID=375451 RepID=Q166Y6_ROSDO|nr:alpha-D-ribose 1-methylphosphonate 5-triphosphate diphosphatase [Roseobacter denitrificans]ABG31957.1 phosphonate metabolism protein PhnM [Roseobacter denitrificans OCh 114]AVL51492.1 alpha-D-ribose 1-methylphosphonate 5-triphosphate diphosphatase [Roseobacter denitrificans]SFG35223.1 alpha-D-ribose 1-methylphosphonate 5-triphosphate diphosphatase [Roseobacter denitrificans OCh 114]